MAKKWDDLMKETFTPEEIAQIEEDANREYTLVELRKAIGMAQATLAQTLGVTQSHISRLERQPDLQISTLRRYIEAMHGELRIVVRLSGREVTLTLADIEHPTAVEIDAETDETERAAQASTVDSLMLNLRNSFTRRDTSDREVKAPVRKTRTG